MRFWSLLSQTIRDAGDAVSITLLTVEGSAPREAGTRMIMRPDGGFHGTIGGGTLEWHALAAAQKLFGENEPAARITRHALGPEMGQCCGGSVRLLVERFGPDRQAEVDALAAQEACGPFTTEGRVERSGVIRTVVPETKEVAFDPSRRPLARAPREEDLGFSRSNNPHPEGGRRAISKGGRQTLPVSLQHDGIIVERFEVRERPVYLFGAGHVGRAIVLAMAPLPFAVTWIDTRADAFPAAMPGNVTAVWSEDAATLLADAPSETMVLILTHNHALDQEITRLALAEDRFAYVGVIGSKTKRARFTKRLAEAGIPRDRIERDLVCPIGMPEIASKHPAALAAGVVADLLARDSVAMESFGNLDVRAVG